MNSPRVCLVDGDGAGCWADRVRFGRSCVGFWIAIAIIGLVLSPSVISAEPEKPEPMPPITAECQVIVLSVSAAMKVMPELLDDTKIEAGAANLQQMIEKGEAELAACLVVKTALGQEGRSREVEEVRYPAEWDPPHLPNPMPKENALEILRHWPIVGFAPTAWETRDVRPRIELTPEVFSLDGKSVAISIKAEDVHLVEFDSYPAGRLPSGEILKIDQPRFHSSSTAARIWFKTGQRILLAAHKVPGEKPQMKLFLLKVLF